MEKKNIDFYLYKNNQNGKAFLLSKVNDDHIKVKMNKENDEDRLLNYALGIIPHMGNVRVFTRGVSLSDNRKEALLKNQNVLHIESNKEHPEIFDSFLNDFEKHREKAKINGLNVNIFDYKEHHFIAFEITINEFKRTLTKHIRKKTTSDAGVAANLIKDIIPKYIDVIDKDAPLTIKSADKAMLRELEQIFSDEKYSYFNQRMKGFEYESFDFDSILKGNMNRLEVLIANHGYDKKVKEEVLADYDEIANPNKLVIYTDASTYIDKKNKVNDSGIGIIIKQDGTDELMAIIDKKLEPAAVGCFDPNHSEGYAILNALKFVIEKGWVDQDTIIEVRSDSLSNVRKLNHIEEPYFISEAIEDFCEKAIPDTPVAFKWVKGHASNVYNIMVDELAAKSLFNENYEFNLEAFDENIEAYKNRNKSVRKMRP